MICTSLISHPLRRAEAVLLQSTSFSRGGAHPHLTSPPKNRLPVLQKFPKRSVSLVCVQNVRIRAGRMWVLGACRGLVEASTEPGQDKQHIQTDQRGQTRPTQSKPHSTAHTLRESETTRGDVRDSITDVTFIITCSQSYPASRPHQVSTTRHEQSNTRVTTATSGFYCFNMSRHE